MITCPGCNAKIKRVYVVSTATQMADLTEENTLTDYSSPEVGTTISVHCPHCDEDLLENPATKELFEMEA